MFYKENSDGSWTRGNEIHFPDGEVLSSNNKKQREGFQWHDIDPPGFSKIPTNIREELGIPTVGERRSRNQTIIGDNGKKIDVSQSSRKKLSLWRRFINFLKRLFKIK